MYLSKRVKVVAGVSALLGLVMAGGAAFTATGITDNADFGEFIGGTVTQNVYGVTLSGIVYNFATDSAGDGSEGGTSNQDEVNEITLTFSNDTVANDNHYIPTVAIVGSSNTATCTGINEDDAATPGTYGATANVAYCDMSAPTTGITAISVTLAYQPITSSSGV
jgi:hypothetical protein